MPTQPRVHLSLNVSNLPASVAFYQTLLGEPPSKSKGDYAKFEPAELAINLALNLVDETSPSSRVSHFGIQVDSPDTVRGAADRLQKAGLLTRIEENVTCCYAVQDKVWVVDPDGNPWEVFVVTDSDSATHSDRDREPDATCCPTSRPSCC